MRTSADSARGWLMGPVLRSYDRCGRDPSRWLSIVRTRREVKPLASEAERAPWRMDNGWWIGPQWQGAAGSPIIGRSNPDRPGTAGDALRALLLADDPGPRRVRP